MVADPCALLVAMPEPEIVAAAAFEELHVAELVRFLVLWSLYVPVAVNCWPAPAATEGVPGVTAIETKVAGAAFDAFETRRRRIQPSPPRIRLQTGDQQLLHECFSSWSLGPKIGPRTRGSFPLQG